MAPPRSSSMTKRPGYVGRFAPSPTGPLHEGSLIAALASFLDARANDGLWLVRMEDLDRPREVPGAADRILDDLQRLGLHWDGDVIYQSRRDPAYQEALSTLRQRQACFECHCSRQEILAHGGIYPGTCRQGSQGDGPAAIRCRVWDRQIEFVDRIQGLQRQDLAREVGDFVVLRKDGLFAYQLAVVVDDAWQGITHVVRGYDLLDSTARQIHLQGLLDYPCPSYAHIPIIVNTFGQKLSKQHFAPAIDLSDPAGALTRALQYLRQAPPSELRYAHPDNILDWAILHWRPETLNGKKQMDEFERPLNPGV